MSINVLLSSNLVERIYQSFAAFTFEGTFCRTLLPEIKGEKTLLRRTSSGCVSLAFANCCENICFKDGKKRAIWRNVSL